jgi:hypothetical protein
MPSVEIKKDPFQESVYRLLKEKEVVKEKPRTYRSIHADEARREYKSGLRDYATMGPLKVKQEPPKDYLKAKKKTEEHYGYIKV